MSPLTAYSAVATSAVTGSLDTVSRSAARTIETARPVEKTSLDAEATVAAGASDAEGGGSSGSASTTTSSGYSARTAYDAATGEWALVIERHPPETGIVVAEQKGFVSQYSAQVNSPATLQNAFSAQI